MPVSTAVAVAVLEGSGAELFLSQVRSRSLLALAVPVEFRGARGTLGRTLFSPPWCQMVVVVVEAMATLPRREALAVGLVRD